MDEFDRANILSKNNRFECFFGSTGAFDLHALILYQYRPYETLVLHVGQKELHPSNNLSFLTNATVRSASLK